jgi:peptidoglycan/xylan/chitin deacetylase (PgdA/CDA1 family)
MHKAIVYHTISTHKTSLPSNIDITPERFEQHLIWLSRRTERVVPLNRLLTEPANKSLITITFDDGYEDNLSVALPLLEKYNLPATIFMVAGFIGKQGYLTGKDLALLAAHPLITIGSHALWHRHLTKLSPGEARHELQTSKQILEETINQPVDFLAYPYGDCNQGIEQISAECGYKAAWSVWNGNNSLHSLWRVPLGTNDNLLRFIAKVSPAYFPVKRFLKPPIIEKEVSRTNREILSAN